MADGDLIPIVKQIVKSGVSCIPIELPSKKPYKALKWTPYMKQRPTMEECEKFWANGAGLALVCGAVSGNLEILDFDVPGKSAEGYVPVSSPPAWKPFLDILKEHGHDDLLKRVLVHKTPSGGRGIFYRCPGPPLPGNTKLAATAKNEVLIETRGQGGYFGTAPSAGYELLQGDLTAIPVIDPEDREILLAAARMLDQRTLDQAERSVRYDRAVGAVNGRPGDWYKEKGPHLLDLLEKHGWKECGRAGSRIAVVRPGKSPGKGLSGTVTADGECFWCFSSSTNFQADHAYDKFSALTVLEFQNDFHAAANHIRRDLMPQTSIGQQTHTQLKAEIASVEERRTTRWVTADMLQPEDVDWILEPYIPNREITMLVGDPGVGKSTLAQAICTAITIGGKIGNRKLEPGNVIFMSAEQSVTQITIPRFKAMGADLSRILLVDEDTEDGDVKPFVLDHAGMVVLREQVEIFKPKLIVIDTVTAYFEAVRNMNAANEVREWMRRLIMIARPLGCGVLVLAHPNKSQSLNALHKISGSIDFSGAARSVLYAGADPDDRSIRAAAHVKSNVGPIGDPIGFTITDEGEFQWLTDCQLSSEQMLEQPQTREARGKRSACEEWLNGLFEGDTEIEATTLLEEAKMLGFSRNLLFELKPKCRLKTERRGYGRDGKTFWRRDTMVYGGEKWYQK